MDSWRSNFGPAFLVTAAFIGPGSVTVCTLAGVQFSYSLLWAILFSILATVFLQEMAARLGLISRRGLAEAVRDQFQNKVARSLAIGLMLSAIVVGNFAYEAGNIAGGALGAKILLGESLSSYEGTHFLSSVFIALLAFALLWSADYKRIESVLIGMVGIMSCAFLLAALLSKPDLGEIAKGLIPNFRSSNITTVIALIGTTVVPYNLFLHAALMREKWSGSQFLGHARRDLVISILLGGIISLSIVVSAASLKTGSITNAAELALSLETVFGPIGRYLLGLGLLSAGITSAITAPLAAAYVARGCFDWQGGVSDWRFRSVWILILVSGTIFSSLSISPIVLIKFAQITNGFLLPIVACFLLWIVNKKEVMGRFRNTLLQNLLGYAIVAVTILLGWKGIMKVLA